MSSLWPADQRSVGADVLNGIALGTDHVLITGKLWDRMYKVDFPNWPTLFASSLKDEVALDNGDEAEDPLAIVSVEEGASEEGEQLQNATTDTFSVIEQVDHDASSFT